MNLDNKKLDALERKVSLLLNTNNIVEFNELLKNELTPSYLFEDNSNVRYSFYKNHNSIFTTICKSGNLDFVKSSIEKSPFSEEYKYFIGTATASGFIKACEIENLEMAKYLVDIDKKYRKIIGDDNGIYHTTIAFDNGKKVVIYDVLDDSVTQSLYKDSKPNLELIEYLFFSNELINHPRTKFEDLVKIFITDNLELFDKLLAKALKEDLDILHLFNRSSLTLPHNKEKLVKLAEYLIHDFKIYEYPGIEEKLLQEPILNTLYFKKQLDNSLENKNQASDIKKIKI